MPTQMHRLSAQSWLPRMLCTHALLCVVAAMSLSIGGCSGDSEESTESNGTKSSAADASKPERLRFTGIPDADKEKLTTQYAAVASYLSDELGIEVEYVHVPDYNGAVTALAANKVDIAWLGGVTSVQADDRTNGQAVFLACRASDRQFKSYFIANTDLNIGSLADLNALPSPETKSLTFGSKSSTSGHVMPRHFLNEAGMVPESTFERVGFQLQGGHSATLAAVQTGQVDLGALNYKTYDNASADERSNVEIIYTTPEYVDYCLVGHERLGQLNQAVADAFAKLDPANESHRPVLEAFSAEQFVVADPSWWDGIRAVLEATPLDELN